jgi:hypothetical protein
MSQTLDKANPSYIYCNICGHVPRKQDEPNYAPLRFWDPDDGWKIGTLCRHCWEDVKDDQPHPDDFAYDTTNHVCDDLNTDEDPLQAL